MEFLQSLEDQYRTVAGEFRNIDILKRRALSKFLTLSYAPHLLVASRCYNMHESVENTFKCSETLYQGVDNQLISNGFCKNRWCLVCNRIRTAGLINRYQPKLDEWLNKHFLTLTLPNVNFADLSKCISLIHKQLHYIKDLSRKKNSPCGSISGFRKFECTYNPISKTFHPHFHLIVKDYPQAHFILSQWLKRFPDASEKAQNITFANSKICKELFKYFTKLVVKTSNKPEIYPNALAHIFANVRGLRVFQPFGEFYNILQKDVENQIFDFEMVGQALDGEKFGWDQNDNDWINKKTGEYLCTTNFKPINWIVNDVPFL